MKLENVRNNAKDVHKRLSVLYTYCHVSSYADEIYNITANIGDLKRCTDEIIKELCEILDQNFTELPSFIKNIKPLNECDDIIIDD